jgi:hypothetical protein
LDKVCRQLLENAIPLLDGLDCLLPTGDPTREVAHDDVAEQVLKCQLAFVKKTENWRVSVELLEMVSPVASSKTISKKIEENLQAVRKNAESNDSFCGEGYFDLPPAHLEEMEDARRLTEQQDFDKALASLETLPRNDLMACPHCRTGLDWTQQRAGSTLNCPFCSREFQAPESAEVFPPESRFLIDKALAHCLLTRGLQRVNQVGAEGGQLIPTLKRIIERLKSNPSALLLAGLGGSGLGRYGARSCMACSCSISPYENHVSFTFKNVPMVVCSSCGAQLQREEDSRKSNLRDAVRASAEDLVRAAQLDPANKLVEQQLGQLREVCSNVGVSFPQAPKAKKPRVSKTPSVPVTSEQSAEAATSGGCKAANWSLGLGFVGAFFSFPLLGGIFDPAYGKSVAAGDFTGTTILASVLAIPAILCGHFALRQIARLNGNSHARTRAKGGLLCGYGALVLLVIAWLVRSST